MTAYFVSELLISSDGPMAAAGLQAMAATLELTPDEITCVPMPGGADRFCWGVYRRHYVLRDKARAVTVARALSEELGGQCCEVLTTWADWSAAASQGGLQ